MSEVVSAPAPEPQAPALNEFSRIVKVFTDPKTAFADILRAPRFGLVAMLILILLGLAGSAVVSKRIGFEKVVAQQMASNDRISQMPAEQRERAVAMGVKTAGIMAYVAPVVFTPLMVLLMAAVLMLIFNMMKGYGLKYAQHVGIAAYALLPGIISSILMILVLFLKNPEDVDIKNPLAFNVGAFLNPETTSKGLLAFATSLDLFTFWIMALLATGYVVAKPRTTFGSAFLPILAAWALLVVCKVGWTAAFG